MEDAKFVLTISDPSLSEYSVEFFATKDEAAQFVADEEGLEFSSDVEAADFLNTIVWEHYENGYFTTEYRLFPIRTPKH